MMSRNHEDVLREDGWLSLDGKGMNEVLLNMVG
jgi:hypothetical protein